MKSKEIMELIDPKYLDIATEGNNLAQVAVELDVKDPLVSLAFKPEDYELELNMSENLKGSISCRKYKNLVFYMKFEPTDDINECIKLFNHDCNVALEKLEGTKRKLATQFKAPIKLFVRVDGRITMVDTQTDLILLDKINPSKADYGRAQKQFNLNRMKLKHMKK